ncbi:MAG: DoxX family protein [Acidobacteriota bacterium]
MNIPRGARVRIITSWILVVLLALGYLAAAAGKLAGAATETFANWGYPAWFATLIGVLELAGAIGLLIPKTMRYAVLGLTAVMIGAAYTHLANNEGLQVVRPAVFLALLWTAWWLRQTPAAARRDVDERSRNKA